MGKFLRSFPVSAGHVTGAGTSDEVGSADMDPTGVTPGSYTTADITVDAAGRITAAANGAGGPSLPVSLADGGTGASLTDPGADRLLFWDDSAGATAFLAAGSGLSIAGTTLTATGSGGTVTSVDGASSAGGFTLTGGAITGAGTLTFNVSDAATARSTLGAAASGAVTAAGLTTPTFTVLGRDGAGTGAIQSLTMAGGITMTGTGVITTAPALEALSSLSPAANKVAYYTGAGTAALTDLTAPARTLLDDTTIGDMRTTLGLVIGTDVQAQDAELAAIAGLTSAADAAPYFTGSGTAALMTVTSAARTVLDDTTVGAMLTTLGGQPLDATLTAFAGLTIAANSLTVGTGADAFSQTTFAANTFPARASTGSLVAKTITDFGLSLVDDADASAGRTTLGLGTSATVNTGTSGATVPLLNGTNQWSAAQRFVNSSGILILDTDASHTLGIVGGSNLTANRTLTVTTGDASRVLTLTADASIGGTTSGTNTGDQTITLTGDVTGAGTGSFAATLANDAVTFAKMQNSAAAGLSVVGRSTNSAGDFAEINAANDGEVLRRSGTAVGFGTVATAGVADNAVTLAKLATVATDRLLGRDTAATGNVEALTVGGGIEFTGSGGIQRSALTGDVTATAGSNSTTVVSASDTVAGKIEIATAAEVETGTDATRAVTPAHQQRHKSAAKAWVVFTISGTTITVRDSYNVTSVTRNGVGDYDINLTTAFSSAYYAVVCNTTVNTAGSATLWGLANNISPPTASVCKVVYVTSGGAVNEAARVEVTMFGDQ